MGMIGWFSKSKRVTSEPVPIEIEEPVPPSKPVLPPGRVLLNLGCGAHYHADWVNIDVAPSDESVFRHDLLEPLPIDDASCDAVYHSHVLEHLHREAAPVFLSECFRVLKPGGVVRVVVPDLETIARLYLSNLDEAVRGDQQAMLRHEWMTLELLDQLVRERTGGLMLEYWKQNPMPVEDFVFERLGWEARRFVERWRGQESAKSVPTKKKKSSPEAVTAFRNSGEVHRWMYDRVSLARLLRETGFEDVLVCSAEESRIPDFSSFHLDADEHGVVRKPDSLFVEAIKPRTNS